MPETNASKTYAVFEHSRNKKLIAELENAGGAVVRIPPPELIKIDRERFGVRLEKISGFDWIIFVDVYAADIFLELLRESDFDLFELDALHICALGESVADRLRFAQIHTDVIPVVNTPEKIVESIENYLYGENDFAGKRFLVLKESGEQLDFVAALEKKSAEVREAAIYRMEYVSVNELPKIKALVKGGAIDEIIFTAPEDYLHCRLVFRNETLTEVLRDAKIFAVDETIRQMLRENQISAALFFAR